MPSFLIPAANLDVILQTPDEALAFIESLPPADRAEVSPDWIARVRMTAPGDPWALGFTVVQRSSGSTVGSCAFKGPPNAEGIVEVAYAIDPAYRGRGFATQATEALVGFALASGKVQLAPDPTMVHRLACWPSAASSSSEKLWTPMTVLVCRWERGQSNPLRQGIASVPKWK